MDEKVIHRGSLSQKSLKTSALGGADEPLHQIFDLGLSQRHKLVDLLCPRVEGVNGYSLAFINEWPLNLNGSALKQKCKVIRCLFVYR